MCLIHIYKSKREQFIINKMYFPLNPSLALVMNCVEPFFFFNSFQRIIFRVEWSTCYTKDLSGKIICYLWHEVIVEGILHKIQPLKYPSQKGKPVQGSNQKSHKGLHLID